MEKDQTEFIKRLKQVRVSLGLSQAELAAKIGIAGSTYPKYESGSSKPGFEALEGFICLGVNANWLIAGGGNMMLEDINTQAPVVVEKSIDADIQLLCLNACINAYGSSFSEFDVRRQLQIVNVFYFKTAVFLKSIGLDPTEMIKLGVDGLTDHAKNLITLTILPTPPMSSKVFTIDTPIKEDFNF